MQREIMHYDIVVVGGGPSGLATAIHLQRLSQLHSAALSVAVLEKGSSIGANIISGCVMDPIALDELIPRWRDLDFPVKTRVVDDELWLLTNSSQFKLPQVKAWSSSGSYIISLSQLCIKLAEYAENLGVDIYPGFAVVKPIIEDNQVKGIITGDMGLDKLGSHTKNYQAGIEIRAKQVVIAEGCRGSLAKQVISLFNLDNGRCPQTYGLGIKEIWQIDKDKHKLGQVRHYLGYPLNNKAYGGGFVYHLENNVVAVGLVASLDYANPYFNPYEEFQKFKLHSEIQSLLINGVRLEYGARAVAEGGYQALPKLYFPGGVLVGDSAGFLNVPKVKGVHTAIKSGMLAAQGIFKALNKGNKEARDYMSLMQASWLNKDLYLARNIRPAFRGGLYVGLVYAAIEAYILKHKVPWTFKWRKGDHEKLKHKALFHPIDYPVADGKVTFDRASSVHLANVSHDDQPCHLCIADPKLVLEVNLENYASPETRYCPAGVYEIVKNSVNKFELQINGQNCIHCKACDIKDPQQNITWVPPLGGSGPQYGEM